MFSRGQKQRLGLARALVHDPHVLLLDEPASGLDPQARIDLRVLLRRFAAEGRTVLVSSHVLAELEELIDDAVFLVAGETVDAGRVAAAARGSREWRIRVSDSSPADAAIAVAAALGRAPDDVAIDRQDVLVAFETERAAAAALRALVQADMAVAEFAPARGSLEQTFLDLGGRGRRLVSLQRIGTLVRLELTQRVRSVAWYVLLGVFFVLLLIVTALAFAVFPPVPDDSTGTFGRPAAQAPTRSWCTSSCCSRCSCRRHSAATRSTGIGMPRPSLRSR